MDLYIIRHGESEADLLGVHEGRADFHLTEAGRRQAHQMAAWLAGRARLDAIYASPLLRARETAVALSARSGVPLRFDDDLMEFQNGLLAGLPFEEADAKYPRPPERHPHDTYYGQESEIVFRMRAETALSRIVHTHTDGETVAIVSHGGTICRLFESFLRLPVASQTFLSTGDTGVHHWRLHAEARSILFLNSLCHLHEPTNQ